MRSDRPSVVIVGSGFGGLYCAKTLARENVYVTLIDRRNFHLFQPLLYQVATGSLSSGEIASPIRSEFVKHKNVTVLQAEVTGIDCESRQVHVKNSESIQYDYLILATGSHHHYFGREEWAAVAPGLKTIEDALEIRSKILGAFEEAELAGADQARATAALTFVVVGGGPTGVELSGTIGELAHSTMRGEFRRSKPEQARIILVENDNRVMTTYSQSLSDKAAGYLRQLGVELMLGWRVTDVTEHDVEVSNDQGKLRIPCNTVLWAAGNKASPLGKLLAEQINAEVDRAGRLMVDAHLNIPYHPEIYVIGDLAHFKGKNGNPLPGVAPVAMQQGKFVGKSIRRRLQKKEDKPFNYFDKGSLAVVGRNRAIAERNSVKVSGFPAWIMWVFIHIAYLIEFQNRIVVLARWAISYFTRQRGARLITGEGLEHPSDAEPSGVHPPVTMDVAPDNAGADIPKNPEAHTL